MKKVLLLLANGFEIFEASAFFDVFGWNLVEGNKSVKIVICGFTKEINSTFGATLIADITVNELIISDYDALAIPGGFGEFNFYNEAYSERFLQIIKDFHREGKTVASICTGALPIGKSGILNGKLGTTYNKRNGIRQNTLREYGVNVIDEPIVEDDSIITSWNPSTALAVAFLLLEKMTSRDNANKVRELMGFKSNEAVLLS